MILVQVHCRKKTGKSNVCSPVQSILYLSLFLETTSAAVPPEIQSLKQMEHTTISPDKYNNKNWNILSLSLTTRFQSLHLSLSPLKKIWGDDGTLFSYLSNWFDNPAGDITTFQMILLRMFRMSDDDVVWYASRLIFIDVSIYKVKKKFFFERVMVVYY